VQVRCNCASREDEQREGSEVGASFQRGGLKR